MSQCASSNCCERWREIGLAFTEGRREEAAHEACRMLAAGEHSRCRTGKLVVAQMVAEGWIEE